MDVRATSARWAWIEYVLAQGGRAEGMAVLDAVKAGGRFADWKRDSTSTRTGQSAKRSLKF